MSIVFDSLWWWRVEFNGQGSPYEVTRSEPEPHTNPDIEVDGSWLPKDAMALNSFGSLNFPEIYMDMDWPLYTDPLN